jgi:hypothetical protein
VLAIGLVEHQVVERRRHGHGAGHGQRPGLPVLVAPDAVAVDPEVPQPVEVLALARGGVLGSKHGWFLS